MNNFKRISKYTTLYLLLMLHSVVVAQSSDTLKAFKSMRRASILFDDSKYNSALVEFQEAEKEYLRHKIWDRYSDALSKQGISLYYLGKYNEAISMFSKIIDTTPESFKNSNLKISESYNDIAVNYAALGNYASAHIFGRKALKIKIDHFGLNHLSTASTINNIGYYFSREEEMDSALRYCEKALDIRLKLLDADDPLIASSYSNLGNIYGKKGDFEKREVYYEKDLALNLKKYGENHPNTARCYNNMGFHFGQTGDLFKMEMYYQKSLSIYLKLFDEEHPSVSNAYYNISSIHSHKKDFVEALKYAHRSLSINLKHFGKNHSSVAKNYNKIGWLHWRMKDYQEAIKYFTRCQEIYKTLYHEEHFLLANGYNNIAKCYQKLGDFEMEKKLLVMAIDIFLKNSKSNQHQLVVAYINLGEHYAKKKQWELALENFQNGLKTLTPSFSDSNPMSNPELKEIHFKPIYLKLLAEKALVLKNYYKAHKDIKLLEMANKTYQLAVEITDLLRFNISSELSKQKITESAIPIYQNVIELNVSNYMATGEKHFYDLAFTFVEKSKAFLLRQALRESNAKRFAHIPDSIVDYDQELKINMAFFKKQFSKYVELQDSSRVEKYRNYILNQQKQYDMHMAMLEKEYPKYYALKYDTKVVKRKEIQQNLGIGDLFIEFFVKDSTVFLFGITQNQFKVFTIPVDDSFFDKITNYRRSNSDFRFIMDSTSIADELYSTSATFLYELLLKDILNSFAQRVKHIIVVSDGELGLINFEAFLINKPPNTTPINYKKLDYLINHYTISHTPSATVWHQSIVSKKSANTAPCKQYAGFAPFYDDNLPSEEYIAMIGEYNKQARSGNWNLKGARDEVVQISEIFDGETFIDSMATESQFKKTSGSYGLLHLAMHGIIGEKSDETFLMFSKNGDKENDGLLHLSEIYNLDLNTDMVILSACHGGYGKVQKGEGVLSLSRAFIYSGSTSVIMSLWALPDEIAPKIIGDFSNSLTQGEMKDDALKQAKINFINSTKDKFKAHPYFWAGLVPVGNMSALTIKNQYTLKKIMGCLGILVLLTFIAYTAKRYKY